MKPKAVTRFNPATVQQLANQIVNRWIERRYIVLRPGDKMALLQTITDTFPTSLENKRSCASCVKSIGNMDEPFPGLVNKQRVLNFCTYSTDSVANNQHNVIQRFPGHHLSLSNQTASGCKG